jgi:hypothetical protein
LEFDDFRFAVRPAFGNDGALLREPFSHLAAAARALAYERIIE